MNPYYAHDSQVGPVFDVATFSVAKAVTTGIVCVVVALIVGVGLVYVWNPNLVVSRPPQWLAQEHKDIQELWQRHPRGTPIGVGLASLFSLAMLVGGGFFLRDAVRNDYYLRAGEGGLSIRIPDSFRAKELDVAWDDIAGLTVIQKKQLTTSRHTGNISAVLRLELRNGEKHEFDLDCFRQPGYMIYDRLQEARQMRPAVLNA